MNPTFLLIFSLILVCGSKSDPIVEKEAPAKVEEDKPRVKRMWADDEPPPPPPPPRPSPEEEQWRQEADLFQACYDGSLDRVRSILTSGMRSRYEQPIVNVNIKFDSYKHGRYVSPYKEFADGVTPLIVAAKNGHLWVAEFLTRRKRLPGGVRVDDIDRSGMTALMHAAREGHYSVVRLLARPPVYADVNLKSYEDMSALMYAALQNQLRIVEFFIQETSAYLNDKNREGLTALMIAARDGHSQVVKLLIERSPGVDVNARDNRGRTAYGLAGTGHNVRSDDRYNTMEVFRRCHYCN